MAYLPQVETPIIPSNTKVSQGYSFNAATKTVSILDSDYETVLFIINTTDNIVIYNPIDSGLGGLVNGDSVIVDYNTTSMSDSDDLLILYRAIEQSDVDELLYLILSELQVQTKLLKKIYD